MSPSCWRSSLSGLAGAGLITIAAAISGAGIQAPPPPQATLNLNHDWGHVLDSKSDGRDNLKIWGTWSFADDGEGGLLSEDGKICPPKEDVEVICGPQNGEQYLYIPANDAGWQSSNGVHTWQGTLESGGSWILSINKNDQTIMAYWTGLDIPGGTIPAPSNGSTYPVNFYLVVGNDSTNSENYADYRNDAKGFNAGANHCKLRKP